MTFQLPPLPYGPSDLEPHLSQDCLEVHHEAHHRGYVEALNEALEGKSPSPASLKEAVRATQDQGEANAVYKNAAQAWNHEFFWASMSPQVERPDGPLATAIEQGFGSFGDFADRFVETATGHFASGWIWLVKGDGGLEVATTRNADPIFTSDKQPLLTCDLWEHAYYLDYRNEKERFFRAFIHDLANWNAAGRRFDDSA